jgi:hypothetical protein
MSPSEEAHSDDQKEKLHNSHESSVILLIGPVVHRALQKRLMELPLQFWH